MSEDGRSMPQEMRTKGKRRQTHPRCCTIWVTTIGTHTWSVTLPGSLHCLGHYSYYIVWVTIVMLHCLGHYSHVKLSGSL